MHIHQPVLLEEVIQGLAIKPNGIYVDGTFGRGGHSQEILKRLGPEGRLMGMDKDPEAMKAAGQGLFRDPRFCAVNQSFAKLLETVTERGWRNKVDGILLDLGVSSPQLDDPERGFSFTREGPLDMRMNPQQGMDAATWINQAEAIEIAHVLRDYGEERFAKRIANHIVQARTVQMLQTTKQLADVIASAVPNRELKKHPATRSFQAIRIFINQELEDLKACLTQSLEAMSVKGRICVISFHSLEDRIVKRFIQRETQGENYPPELPLKDSDIKRRLRKIGGLIRPNEKAIEENNRARSARLRIAEKIG